ncbi:hypothetical protein [Pseudolysinimonas kribbensis]|uniref:hypothetical protein n=1 Tax=Pseudolysinimonas kribbensis TaxID=433641 RepID=UPI0024E162D0|nr:hypothetical protein [Pseudolysinimonas kribbensis]
MGRRAPPGVVRLLGIVIPAAALFAPLVVAQLRRGTPLALLADPGATVAWPAPTGWELLLGHPAAGTGWQGMVAGLGLPTALGLLLPAVLLAPVAVLALLALFLPGSRRAIPALVIALTGLVTAVVAVHLPLASSAGDVVTPGRVPASACTGSASWGPWSSASTRSAGRASESGSRGCSPRRSRSHRWPRRRSTAARRSRAATAGCCPRWSSPRRARIRSSAPSC